MFCSTCGQRLSDTDKFCPQCGAPVPRTPDLPAASGPREMPPVEVPFVEVPPVEIIPPDVQVGPVTAVKVKPPDRKPLTRNVVLLGALAVAAAAVLVLPRIFSPGEQTDREGPDSSGTAQVPGGVPSQEAAAELLGYVDQAEELCLKANDEIEAMSGTGDDALFRKSSQILNEFLSELEELQGQAAALNGLDDKLKSAQKEYFSMLYDSRTAYAQVYTFMADYLDFCGETLDYRPLSVDFDTLTEYSEALNEWTQSTREKYSALSCPPCMKSEWEQYGESLAFNESIAKKVERAVAYNDSLRFHSAQNMAERYTTVDDALFSKFLTCLKGEQDFARRQRNYASALAEEMHSYAEFSREEKDAYEFENIYTGMRLTGYDAVSTIYPSLYNTYDAFVIVKTGCISGTSTIVVEAEIPGFTQKYTESFKLDSSYKAIYIKPPALTGQLDLSASKDAQINVTISKPDGTLLSAKTFPVTIKSKYDFEWYSDEYGVTTKDNILCFLTPESATVTKLKRQAIEEISAITNGEMESFVGYQNVNPDWNQYAVTYLQAAGLMNALCEMGVRYNNGNFSISGSNQHVLFPADVIDQQGGLCIETSLVIASALQSAGMHAFLLFPPGHAQVAVEVWNEGSHAGEYFLIETTALDPKSNNKELFTEGYYNLLEYAPSGHPITYYSASQWEDYLENKVQYIIDCDDSRLLGLTPFAN